MARWKLLGPHYINVPGEVWEYKEQDRTTGREVRRQLPVPMFLDPRDPGACNYTWGNRDNLEGEIIICWKGKGEPKDIVFEGDPTPDMVPLDPEAVAISESFAERWKYKPEVDTSTFSQSLVDKFQIEMAEVKSKPQQVEGLSELVASLALMAKNQEAILAHLAKPRGI